MPIASNISEQHRQHVRMVWIGLAILAGIILAAVVAQYIQQRRQREIFSTTAVSATPLSFNDVVGTVTKIDGSTLSVDVVITNRTGQTHHRTYRVVSDDQTIVKTESAQGTSPSSFSALKVGDRVQVAASGDIASVDHFTATKIYQLVT